MTQVERVERDLARLPSEIAEGAVAGAALVMARVLDGEMKGSVSECGRVMLESLETLRSLAPKESRDELDELRDRRADRLAGRAAAAN